LGGISEEAGCFECEAKRVTIKIKSCRFNSQVQL
jgi:hypothetical protein